MEQIELKEPHRKYAADIWRFRQEILECDAEHEDRFAGCLSLDVSKSAEEWIEICRLRKKEETCGETGTEVPAHMGGHCGYSVRPSERGKGYATEMLRLNIQNAKALEIPRLLVTCDVRNEASEKVILANGGVYETTIDVDGSRIKRYWITV